MALLFIYIFVPAALFLLLFRHLLSFIHLYTFIFIWMLHFNLDFVCTCQPIFSFFCVYEYVI